jgi:hypothetical protein
MSGGVGAGGTPHTARLPDSDLPVLVAYRFLSQV